MKLTAHIGLIFDGNCAEALKFYERTLGGKIEFLLTWGDSPMAADAPPGWDRKIMHARLAVGETALLAGDALPGTYERPQGFSLLLGIDKAPDAERLFQALSEDGKIRMPLRETFWAERFGGVTDRFGIPWEINCEKPQ
jgi:PhnB protein